MFTKNTHTNRRECFFVYQLLGAHPEATFSKFDNLVCNVIVGWGTGEPIPPFIIRPSGIPVKNFPVESYLNP